MADYNASKMQQLRDGNGASLGEKKPDIWISAQDSPPKKRGRYLAYLGRNIFESRAAFVYYDPEYSGLDLEVGVPQWYIYDSEWGDISYTDSVTHWMKEPSPPKDFEQ